MSIQRAEVLVVDDSSETRLMVTGLLHRKGVKCSASASGQEALEQIRFSPEIGLVLLDINMVGMDGFKLMQEIGELKERRGFAVCMMTSHRSPDSVIKAARMGADSYLIKLKVRKVSQKILK